MSNVAEVTRPILAYVKYKNLYELSLCLSVICRQIVVEIKFLKFSYFSVMSCLLVPLVRLVLLVNYQKKK